MAEYVCARMPSRDRARITKTGRGAILREETRKVVGLQPERGGGGEQSQIAKQSVGVIQIA